MSDTIPKLLIQKTLEDFGDYKPSMVAEQILEALKKSGFYVIPSEYQSGAVALTHQPGEKNLYKQKISEGWKPIPGTIFSIENDPNTYILIEKGQR